MTLGNLAVIQAYRIGEMSVVSPFRYTVILTSLAVGFLMFGELPDLRSVLGIVLVVAAGSTRSTGSRCGYGRSASSRTRRTRPGTSEHRHPGTHSAEMRAWSKP